MQETYRVDISREALEVEKEYQNVRSIIARAEDVFKVDFRFELRYLHGNKPAPQTPLASDIEKEKEEESKIEPDSGSFKKIRNELAKLYHPDSSEEDEVETFKKVQEAYEEGNYSKLLDMAIESDIKINLSPSDVANLKSIIDTQRSYIKEKTETLEWAWFHCERTNMFRQQAWEHMKIDGSEFEKWLGTVRSSLAVIEAECLARKSVDREIKIEPIFKKKKSRNYSANKILLLE